MRLSPVERTVIVEEIRKKTPAAQVYLYGSRVDDQLKGGDIDLLVISSSLAYMNKIDILLAIKSRIGEQKIDLKIVTPAQAGADPFVQSILPTAVRLDAAYGEEVLRPRQ